MLHGAIFYISGDVISALYIAMLCGGYATPGKFAWLQSHVM